MKLTDIILQRDKLKRRIQLLSFSTILLIIGILSGGYYFFSKYNQNVKQQIQTKDTRISLLENEISVYKDRNGVLQSQIISQQGTIKTLKDNIDLLDTDVKSLRKQVGNLNNLLFVTKSELQASNKGTVKFDTTFLFRDRFIDISGHLQLDSMLIFYKTKPIIITHVAYVKRPLFAPNYTVVDVAIKPQMQVLSGQSFIVKHDKKLYEKPWPYAVLSFVFGYWLGNK